MASRLQYELLKHTGSKPEIPKEVANDMRRVDQNAFRRAWIHNRESLFWKGPYKEVYEKLKKRLTGGDESSYQGIETEELYPLIRTIRLTTEGEPGVTSHPYFPVRVRMPVKLREPKGTDGLEHTKIRLGYGQAVNHFDELFPGGVFESDDPAPLFFTFMETGEDPKFDIEILKKDAKTLREEYVIEMNVNKLRGFYRRSRNTEALKADLKRRGYIIKAEETIPFYYILAALPGRRKEMPPVPLKTM